jgi:hypothetical protein
MAFAVTLVYFVVFIPINATGARDGGMLALTSQDEAFQFPFLVHMLTGGETLFETIKHFISYQHYIYGYPFYFFSALVTLPLSLASGNGLSAHTQLALLILRQLVSVLPLIAATLLLVNLQTGFKLTWKSLPLLVFLFSLPGVIRQNIFWWHPDALTLLAVVLVFYFLERDDLRFGRHFYLAAAACGLAAGTKLIGVFFFLAIPVYIFLAVRQGRINLRKAALLAALFAAVMLVTILITNPLLLFSETRARIIETHSAHNFSFTHGWEEDTAYQGGPLTWFPVLEKWYGNVSFLALAFIALAVSTLRGEKKRLNLLILCWVVPYSMYLFFFIAVRPDHYWLPVILPMVSGFMGLIPAADSKGKPHSSPSGALILWAVSLILFIQFCTNLSKDIPLISRAARHERILLACDSNPLMTANLDPEAWYSIRFYDQSMDPPVWRFVVQQGKTFIPAIRQTDSLAWACQTQAVALLKTRQDAADYKAAHPTELIFGPDGKEILP